MRNNEALTSFKWTLFLTTVKWSKKGWIHLNHNPSLILKKVSIWLTCYKFLFKVQFSSFSLFPKQKGKLRKKFRFFSAKIFQSKVTSHPVRKALQQKTKPCEGCVMVSSKVPMERNRMFSVLGLRLHSFLWNTSIDGFLLKYFYFIIWTIICNVWLYLTLCKYTAKLLYKIN